jgi:hypothetical protein
MSKERQKPKLRPVGHVLRVRCGPFEIEAKGQPAILTSGLTMLVLLLTKLLRLW